MIGIEREYFYLLFSIRWWQSLIFGDVTVAAVICSPFLGQYNCAEGFLFLFLCDWCKMISLFFS